MSNREDPEGGPPGPAGGYEEPQGGSGDEPVEPGPLIPPTGPAFRLVPGIGNLEE